MSTVIPVIVGDGIGSDIWKAAKLVINEAVSIESKGTKKIEWMEVYAGQMAYQKYKDLLPQETMDALEKYKVGIKGPLNATPAEWGKSATLRLRQDFDLYACIRPVTWFGNPSPIKYPESVDLTIFRENSEDLYAAIEWKAGDEKLYPLKEFMRTNMNISLKEDAAIAIRPISERASKRIARAAMRYALEKSRKNITIVHKGNVMKHTDGSFHKWCREVLETEFGEYTVNEENYEKGDNRIVIKDRIADNMFQQLIRQPQDYDVIITTNLMGDLLSDAAAALVGGLGYAPGANIGDSIALFEATHGSAPKYADCNIANPTSLILSTAMMLEHLGMVIASELIVKAVRKVIGKGIMTKDAQRHGSGLQFVGTAEYAEHIVREMQV